jgi:hypothetical protein
MAKQIFEVVQTGNLSSPDALQQHLRQLNDTLKEVSNRLPSATPTNITLLQSDKDALAKATADKAVVDTLTHIIDVLTK